MSQITAVEIFAGEANEPKDNFIEELVEQRKKKKYTYNPISIRVIDGGLIHNADTIKQGVALMRIRADEAIKNELDLENIELLKQEFNEVYEWLQATRISATGEFDKIKKEYTANEKSIKDEIIADISKQILKMKEKQFGIAESNIKKHLTVLIEENKDLGIGLDLFDSFIENKRKTAGMLPSDKTKTTSANSLRIIKDEFEKIAEPIRKAQELDKQKSLQSKNFQHYIDGISVDADNREQVEAGIASLIKLKETVPSNFPNIIEECNRSIKNKIETGDANIRAVESLAKRNEAEKKLNASKEHDAPYMEKVETLKDGTMLDDVDALETKLTQFRELHALLKDEKNKEDVVAIAESIKGLISQKKMEAKPQIVEVKTVEIIVDAVAMKSFGISDEAIDGLVFDLQMVSVEAEDVSSARGEIIAQFSELFKIEFIKEF